MPPARKRRRPEKIAGHAASSKAGRFDYTLWSINPAPRQGMHAARIVIGVRRRRRVEMRLADRGKEQRIGLGGNDAKKAGVAGHE